MAGVSWNNACATEADDRRRDESIHDAEDPEAIRAEDWWKEMCTAT
jgi:hypothetical protein